MTNDSQNVGSPKVGPSDSGDQFGSPLTRAIRAGIDTDSAHGAVVPPLYFSSNYTFAGLDDKPRYDYSRCNNPTRDVLAEALATLENGAGAAITNTGLAAINLVLTLLLRVGDTIVVPHDAYGGTWRMFDQLSDRGHFKLVTIDLTDTAAASATIAEVSPKLVWLETPSNPLMRITDLAALSEAAHAAGALVVADNTFCSPVLQRPIDFGVDVVVHSTTKYINGHSDSVGGAVVSADAEMAAEFHRFSNVIGATGGAFDSYQTMRGLRTLSARMRVHQENAAAITEVLTAHPAVAAVHYPGLADHPGHELAAKQQSGFGAMLSFELASRTEVEAFVPQLRHFTLAESLGGTESLLAHPATMTHAAMPPEAQQAAGITPGMIRLSVGIEHVDDLVADVTRGLDAVSN